MASVASDTADLARKMPPSLPLRSRPSGCATCLRPSYLQLYSRVRSVSTGADGSFTSGGTQSIFLALKTARDLHKLTKPFNGVLPARVREVAA